MSNETGFAELAAAELEAARREVLEWGYSLSHPAGEKALIQDIDALIEKVRADERARYETLLDLVREAHVIGHQQFNPRNTLTKCTGPMCIALAALDGSGGGE